MIYTIEEYYHNDDHKIIFITENKERALEKLNYLCKSHIKESPIFGYKLCEWKSEESFTTLSIIT